MNLQKNRLPALKLALAAVAAVTLTVLPAKAAPSVITLTNIFSFPSDQYSVAGLVQGTNGNFYGTTLPVGTNGHGNIFMLTQDGVFTNLVAFGTGNIDGTSPDAPLFLAQNGIFYGTTSTGGSSNYGTIFSITQTGKFTSLTNFGGGNGAYPIGGLVQATNQIFYGTTYSGGAYGFGTVFAYSVTNGLSTVYSFTGTNDGAYPAAGVVVGVNGDLYGTTYEGGTNGLGTVFQLTTGGGLTTLATLSLTNGAFPVGLVQATNGNLFGAAFAGGSNGFGDVFEIPNRSTTLSVLASFDITNGSNPDAPLLLGSDGLIYGTTIQGGAHGVGLVFQVSTNVGRVGRGVQSTGTNSALSAEDSFQAATGAYPEAGLMQASDGNFYGTTTSGGANGTGSVFEVLGFAPTILLQPTNLSLSLKGTALFSVQAGGSAPLFYQWRMNGTNLTDAGNISGATTNQLTISNEVLTDSAGYTVIVSNAFGTITSAVANLTVPVPTLTISSRPATVTNATLVVKGTAAGKYGVTNVFYQILYQTNTGKNWATVTNGWVNAPPSSANWSATVTLQGGTNLFQAYSVDPLGNPSLTNTVTVFYTTHSLLTLATTGAGSISPKVAATNLVVGKSYTITATPAKDNLFSNWSGTLASATNQLTFLMVSNMFLTANFVPNPFLIANVAGPFNGLFSVSTNVAADTSGLLMNLKVGTQGAYTGKLYVGGSNYSVTGSFNVAGNASNQITRAFTLGDVTLTMNLNWNTNPPQVTGTVAGRNGGAWTASLLAELAGTGLGSAEYTMLIPPGTNVAVASPSGDGYATITNHDGTATIAGALADGASFSENIAESADGDLAIFAMPYSNTGLLMGVLTLTNGSPQGDLTWIKPAAAGGLFPDGYTNVVTVQSTPWTDPGKKNVPLQNAQLEVSGALLAAPLVFNVALDYTNDTLVVLPGGPTNSLTGTINRQTGLLKITFGNGHAKQTTTGAGVLLQNPPLGQALGGGYFTTSTNTGAFTLQP